MDKVKQTDSREIEVNLSLISYGRLLQMVCLI